MKKGLALIFIMTLLSSCSNSEVDKNIPTPQQKSSSLLHIKIKPMGIPL